jgi:hypothetical protein
LTKPIPVRKKKPTKRSDEIRELFDPKSQRMSERQISKVLMELDERADEREEYVQKILAANDDSILKVVGHMIEELQIMEGRPKFTVRDRTYNTTPVEQQQLERIQLKNFRYIAVRSLVACALMDIRVGNFRLPKGFCARCGVKCRG